jgi:hypothetical protein
MSKQQAIAMKKRRADARSVVAVRGVEFRQKSRKTSADATPEPGLSRTGAEFSSDVYTKMLANPSLSPTQRASIEDMLGRREQKEKIEKALELEEWLGKTESRRELAASRKELEILKALRDRWPCPSQTLHPRASRH